jgi:hypothetical protein
LTVLLVASGIKKHLYLVLRMNRFDEDEDNGCLVDGHDQDGAESFHHSAKFGLPAEVVPELVYDDDE